MSAKNERHTDGTISNPSNDDKPPSPPSRVPPAFVSRPPPQPHNQIVHSPPQAFPGATLQTFNSSGDAAAAAAVLSPRWRSSDDTERQRTPYPYPYPYGNFPANNNRPIRFFRNPNRNFLGGPPRNPPTPLPPSSSSSHDRPQFHQRPRFVPRPHVNQYVPRNYFRYRSNETDQETNAGTKCKSRKRKLKSEQSGEPLLAKKPWNLNDALKALTAEMELPIPKKNYKITSKIVRDINSVIKYVRSSEPCDPRYGYRFPNTPNTTTQSVVNEENETTFQHEKTRVEMSESLFERGGIPECLECIDPYVLYLGNLSKDITTHAVKDEFPKATSCDIGGKKSTRYAFIKFSNVEDAIQAFKEKYNLVINSRPVILKFWRHKGNDNPLNHVDKLSNKMNEFAIQNLCKKFTRELIVTNSSGQVDKSPYEINELDIQNICEKIKSELIVTNPPGQVDDLPNELNEFDIQNICKKIIRELIISNPPGQVDELLTSNE